MKIGVIGCGQVGAACAYACALRGVGSELALLDVDPDLARAQAEDLRHAAPFSAGLPVRAGCYEALEGARVLMIAAGVPQKDPRESRLDLLKRNAEVFAEIVPQALAVAPEALLLIASNPVDVMTDFAARMAGAASEGRVIGSGTILDTARFRAELADHLGVSAHSVHGYVLGEHGDTEVLHWSGAKVGTLPMAEVAAQLGAPVTRAVRERVDERVRRAAHRIIAGKGATWFGVAAGMARLAEAILDDQNAVLTCCAPTRDVGGVAEVTLSLPRLVGARGIGATLRPNLDPGEEAALALSAEILAAAAGSLCG